MHRQLPPQHPLMCSCVEAIHEPCAGRYPVLSCSRTCVRRAPRHVPEVCAELHSAAMDRQLPSQLPTPCLGVWRQCSSAVLVIFDCSMAGQVVGDLCCVIMARAFSRLAILWTHFMPCGSPESGLETPGAHSERQADRGSWLERSPVHDHGSVSDCWQTISAQNNMATLDLLRRLWRPGEG